MCHGPASCPPLSRSGWARWAAVGRQPVIWVLARFRHPSSPAIAYRPHRTQPDVELLQRTYALRRARFCAFMAGYVQPVCAPARDRIEYRARFAPTVFDVAACAQHRAVNLLILLRTACPAVRLPRGRYFEASHAHPLAIGRGWAGPDRAQAVSFL